MPDVSEPTAPGGSRVDDYIRYHRASARIGDIDPAYGMLEYVCRRFELSDEQRYWYAWLYAMTYQGAAAFYLYNEFPDYERVDVARMHRWWTDRGRDEIRVQSDRRWVRSSSMFVPAFESYREWIDNGPGMRGDPAVEDQARHFDWFATNHATPESRYDALYESASSLHSFGQFALFLYLEALHTITPIELCPTDLDLDKAWSCRNGLYYAHGLDHLVEDKETRTRLDALQLTSARWRELREILMREEHPPSVWQTETMLCAYRKWHRGKRYVGFYLDRQAQDIAKMQESVPGGVHWQVLWDYRAETYDHKWLVEKQGMIDLDDNGKIDKAWTNWQRTRTSEILSGVREP